MRDAKVKLAAVPKDIASRIASENAIDILTAAAPEMIGGSADLTGSNNTRPKGSKALSAVDYGGRFIHYGVREHGMAAAMNGMALHGGIIPFRAPSWSSPTIAVPPSGSLPSWACG